MREVIGGTWLTQLIIVFMFVFVSFLALSMNYSKAFRVKNEVLTFVEKNEGLTDNSVWFINNYLSNSGYNTQGNCEKDSYGAKSLNTNNNTYEKVTDSKKKYYYCISKIKSSTTNFDKRAYYKVKLFFKFNLPVIGNIFTFNIDGQTKDVLYPADGNCENNAKIQCQR